MLFEIQGFLCYCSFPESFFCLFSVMFVENACVCFSAGHLREKGVFQTLWCTYELRQCVRLLMT